MKKTHYYRITFLFLFLFLSLPHIQAQKDSHNHIRCATVENQQRLQQEGKLSSDNAFETWMAAKQEEMKANKMMGNEITIPVVVHVIHNGDPVGTNENLSEAQILSQIQVLNEDFGRMIGSPGYNTDAVGADTGIEWCMAQTDPSGNPTDGINRVQRAEADYTSAAFDSNVKPVTQWDPTQYCNVWVAELSGGILGYAQFPEGSGLAGMPASDPANTDGVVMTANAFGTADADDGTFYLNPTYNLGRTMTHEVGHWIGLRHIWGDGACGTDDFVADTPESDDANYSCVTHTSCNTVDMIENYMDYTNDACMNIFTAGQKARIDVVMANSPRRMELATSNKCTPKTEISFRNDASTITENNAVMSGCTGYRDIDLTLRISAEPSADATVNLMFGGTATEGEDYDIVTTASPVFLSGQNMLNIVTIRVYDDAGEEGTETIVLSYAISTGGDAEAGRYNQTHTISIEDNDDAPVTSSFGSFFTEDFGGGIPATWSNVDAIVGGGKWEYTTSLPTNWTTYGIVGTPSFSTEGNGYILFDSDIKGDDGSAEDAQLTSAAINCSSYTGVTLKFQQQFCNYQNDITSVEVSNDGVNYTPFVFNEGLAQGDCTTQPENVSLDISGVADGQANVYIRFRYQGNWDYWWMVDDILLEGERITSVQASDNTAGAQEHRLGANATVHYYDPATGNIMLTIENLSPHDYGCTSVSVNRDGTGTAAAWDPDTGNYISEKTFDIVPTTNSPTGNYNIRLYYTAAEVDGWAAATGRPASDLGMIKTEGDITSPQADDAREYAVATSGTFGTDYTFTSTFNSGFSDFAIGPIEAPLPVELLTFSGKHISDRWNALTWTTASETNSELFEVQHSTNVRDFETIGTVAAAGESGSSINYAFQDRNYKQGNNYYRLKMIDLDGTFAYSNIINIGVETKATISVLPNPTKGVFNVELSHPMTGNVDLSILDMTGKVVLNERIVADELSSYSLNLEGMPAGIYLIRIQVGIQQYLARIVKQSM